MNYFKFRVAKRCKHLLAALAFFCVCSHSIAVDGLDVSAAVDLAGGFGLTPNSGGPSQLNFFREGEISVFSPADHIFDGLLTLAAEVENGSVALVLHEAFLGSSKLIPRSRFRVGQFFLGVGRINRIHRHDWPFTSVPRANDKIFSLNGAEAAFDAGLEYSYLFPLPLYLDLTVGVMAGRHFGHSHGAGAVPKIPTHYAHLLTYADLPSDGGVQLGLNYVGRQADTGSTMLIFGLDGVAKWREGKRLLWLIQTEFWYRNDTLAGTPSSNQFGGYLFGEHGLSEVLYTGLRTDFHKEVAGNNYYFGFVPQVTWKPSEFTMMRLSYKTELAFLNGNFARTNHFAEMQAVFILGSHPAHEF